MRRRPSANRGDCRGARRVSRPGAGRRRDARARHPGAGRGPAGAAARAFHRAAATRGRQDPRRRAFRKSARPPISAATMPRKAESCSARARPCRGRPARATCCSCAAVASSSRYRRGIFRWRSSLGQVTAALMAGNAVVAKPAEQTPLIAAEAVRLLHQAGVPASALHLVPGDGTHRRGAGRASRHRRRRLHRLDRGRAIDQPDARRQGRPDRAADRGNRRHQCDDRRCHRAARAGRRRRRDLGIPLRRPALLGVAVAVRAGRCRRPHDRDDRRRRARTCRSATRANSPPMSGR